MPLYKVGDKVRIRSQYINPKEDTQRDYPCSFTRIMLRDFGGKLVTICEVQPHLGNNQDRKYYIEPYFYLIKEDEGDGFQWDASMFEKIDNYLRVNIF